MYYPDELVEEVRHRNDIYDVISGYVRLQKKGSNYFGLCPFHNEKSPSFSVSPGKQIYYCFGCGAGGNVLTFVMEYENYTFVEALKFLAERVGMKLPEIGYSEEARKRDDLKSRILQANGEAGKYYYYQLRSEDGKKAYQYLRERGLSDDTIKKFGLGFAKTGKANVYQYLRQKGFSDELLRQCGIFNFDERNGMMDKFWNRVIFPIMDVNHRIIGFGGRVMGQGEPKYLNSPETAVFDKGRNLYGLNLARTSRAKNFILCEGYMDVISLHQAGFHQAVAALGTAFTSGQANLLKRYTQEVYLCFDSDGAGVKAALRAIPIIKETGLSAKVIDMRPYKDPDEFIKNLGAEEFQLRIENAENSFYFEIRMMEGEFDLKDPDGKTKFATNLAQKLLRFHEEIERDSYLEAMCERYHLSSDALRKMVNKFAMQSEGFTIKEAPKSGIHSKKTEDGALKSQGLLLTWITDEPKIYDICKKYIVPSDFTEELYQKTAELLFEQLEKGELNPAGIISCFTNEEEQRNVARLFSTTMPLLEKKEDKEQTLGELLVKIKSFALESMAKSDTADVTAIVAGRRQLEELKRTHIMIT